MYLHLLRDIDMLDFLNKHGVTFNGDVNYFNEIFSEGELTEDIFGAEFCSCRSVFHELPQEDYEEQALIPIKDFLALDYEELHLYFTEGYEDIINLIGILAYIDRNSYEGIAILHVIDNDYNVLRDINIDFTGFYALYCEIFLFAKMPQAKLPAEISSKIVEYMQNRQKLL